MAIDHSRIYETRSLKNLPHRLRMKAILSLLEARNPSPSWSYGDFGCSNGYITNIVASRFGISDVRGLDHSRELLDAARTNYPNIEFDTVDLNQPNPSRAFDLVTCFETLEHVGDLRNALSHLISATNPGGLLLISVPIEVGLPGLAKFLLKTTVYRRIYQSQLDELSTQPIWWKYFAALAFHKDISVFREKRTSWGTHFGFDYRAIDRILNEMDVSYTGTTRGSTRFYVISMRASKNERLNVHDDDRYGPDLLENQEASKQDPSGTMK